MGLYSYCLKTKADLLSLINSYNLLQKYKKRYDDVMHKLRNLSLKGVTKYSVLIAANENKIQTTPDDKAYEFEVRAFHLRRIIEISIHVLEGQMLSFKNNFYKKYANEIMELKSALVTKNLIHSQIWEKLEGLIKI